MDTDGVFGDATRAAVEAFQHLRGLRVDGVCGEQTWNTLVEAGLRLGDRFLYRRTPMQRGDDVADLQLRLSTLGFDTGRVDGIFGDATSRALAEFQRNAGLPVDGIAGEIAGTSTTAGRCVGSSRREAAKREASAAGASLLARTRSFTSLRAASSIQLVMALLLALTFVVANQRAHVHGHSHA